MDAVTKYEQARMALDLAESKVKELKDEIMAPIQAQLAEVDAEWDDKLAYLQHEVEVAEAELRAQVLIEGGTIKGDHVTASFVKSREKMNMDAVKGFMRAHNADPSVFVEKGEPTVQIRWTR